MVDKLAELILYIAERSQDDTAFGATKLNKTLFLADFHAYGLWGKSISGATYVHREHGPVPREILTARDSLVESRRAAIQEREHFGKIQKRLLSLDSPNMKDFSEEEMRLIDDVINEIKHLNATELSDETHKMLPWLETEDGEVLPYFTIFTLKRIPITRAGFKLAAEAIQRVKTQRDAK